MQNEKYKRWQGFDNLIANYGQSSYHQNILGSLIRIVTTSSKLEMPSNTLSSNTVVNSCSIEVNRATKFKESILRSLLKSASNLTSFKSIISRSRNSRRMRVSIQVTVGVLRSARGWASHELPVRNWEQLFRHYIDWLFGRTVESHQVLDLAGLAPLRVSLPRQWLPCTWRRQISRSSLISSWMITNQMPIILQEQIQIYYLMIECWWWVRLYLQLFIICSFMAHLFNKAEYFDYRAKVYSGVKKTLQTKVEQMTESFSQPLHPMELQEDIVVDGVQVNIHYEGQTLPFPIKLLQVSRLADIINLDVVRNQFDQQQIQELLQLLPKKDMDGLKFALEGKNMCETHIHNFERKLKTGYFTTFREKEDEINQKLSLYRMKEIYQNLFKTIMQQRANGFKVQKFTYEDDGSSVQSINDLSQIEDMSQNSQVTETEEQLDDFIDEQYNPRVFFRYDYSKIKGQEELLALGEEKIDKKAAMYKITLPIRPKNSEWVENYRKQEFQRYANPTKPWTYNCEDSKKVTVAPVAKKISVLTGKPRDHPLLKAERPACVTILTLVRDAAARLPSGVGTRADISELLKESQYVNEDLPEQKLSNIVSGALDRLHYMTDACVKYDSQKKLWIYLHSDRNYQHPGWGDEGEDYLDKVLTKKKKREFQ